MYRREGNEQRGKRYDRREMREKGRKILQKMKTREKREKEKLTNKNKYVRGIERENRDRGNEKRVRKCEM